jgi:hypothetical protein
MIWLNGLNPIEQVQLLRLVQSFSASATIEPDQDYKRRLK